MQTMVQRKHRTNINIGSVGCCALTAPKIHDLLFSWGQHSADYESVIYESPNSKCCKINARQKNEVK